ncbi:MAG: DUF3105 domain-containing protein [Alphaproteobacteria bacterium]|nr:DUF3105 domain-containing protein [Alphaproteobacteria bacterium]
MARLKSKPKSRKRRKASSGQGLKFDAHQPKARMRRDNIIIGALVALAVLGGGAYWYTSMTAESAFLALAAEGEPGLAHVKTQRSNGGGHYAPHETGSYPSRFPTSGIHHPVPINPGFYTAARSPGRLVHSAEHGHIVIYYDKPEAETLAMLEDWSSLYTNQWGGVVVTPMPGIGKQVVLTAWTKRLMQKQFDRASAAAFIEKFRGRGPENPIR